MQTKKSAPAATEATNVNKHSDYTTIEYEVNASKQETWLAETVAMVIEQGYRVTPVFKGAGAKPYAGGQTYPSPSEYRNAIQIGVVLDDVILLDWDGNKGDPLPLPQLAAKLGLDEMPCPVQENNEGNSLHFLFKRPEGVSLDELKHSCDGWMPHIDLKTGNQLMHLKQHKIINDSELPKPDELPAAPKVIIDALRNTRQTGKSSSTVGSADEWLETLLDGKSLHGSALALIMRWARLGLTDAEIVCFFGLVEPRLIELRGAERVAALMGDELQRMINGAREIIAKDTPQADASAFFNTTDSETKDRPEPEGVDLLKPPGLAGEICRYMSLNARRDRPELYPFAALHLMALIGRKRKSIFTDKLNLITLSIALTGAGKENTQDAVKRLARDQFASNLIHGNAGSFKELIENLLDGHGASLYVVDEIHSLLGSMKNKNAATYETKIEAEILTMSSTKLYTFRGMEKRELKKDWEKQAASIAKMLDDLGTGKKADEKRPRLERAQEKIKECLDWLENGLPDPFFSLMGHSVPSRLDSFIKTENIDSGFLGRSLIARAPEARAKLRRGPVDPHELALCELNITNGLEGVRRSGAIVGVDEDAAEFLDLCVDWYDDDEQLNHHIGGGIFARAPEHLYRVATILALGNGTITLEHARYADALVRHSIDNINYILLKAYAESDGAQEKQVIEHARQTTHRNCKGTGLSPSRLKDLVTRPKGWQIMQAKDVKRDRFAELIDTMLTDGELELQEDGRRKRYISLAKV